MSDSAEMACLSTKRKKAPCPQLHEADTGCRQTLSSSPTLFCAMPESKPSGKVWSEVGHGGEFIGGGGAMEGSS